MNLQDLRSEYLPFLTLLGRYPYFFLLPVPSGPNFGVFWAITPVKNIDFAEILTRARPHKYVTTTRQFLKTSNFYDRRTYSKFAFLVQLLV